MQCYIALEFNRADLKGAGGNQHCSSAILMTRLDGCLQCRCVECNAISLRAILANVVDASSEIFVEGTRLRRLEGKPSL